MSSSADDQSVHKELPDGEVLPSGFFSRPSDEVAADLVGKLLWRPGIGGGRVTEVEAYLPEADPACHAARGRTERNAPMFGPPGRLYVFLSYGVHSLLNIVCEPEGVGSAVLIRSYEPSGSGSAGGDGAGGGAGDDGAAGPGRVGSALRIRLDMSGLALGDDSGVFVLDDGERPPVGRTVRVGISRGEDLALRHYLVGSRYVSGPAWMLRGQAAPGDP
jgi:DNA-3-methyladenine glycosylase